MKGRRISCAIVGQRLAIEDGNLFWVRVVSEREDISAPGKELEKLG